MKLEYHNIKDGGRFIVTNFQCDPSLNLLKENDLYKIVWCQQSKTSLKINGYEIKINEREVLFCTPIDVLNIPKDNSGLIAYAFNREFYCILHNDSEVSCMGILFYGFLKSPVVRLNDSELKTFTAILTLLRGEYEMRDQIQMEMLRTLLKRMLITATKLIKRDQFTGDASGKQTELIRKYNILVEQHFKEKHQVADYAALLLKSPKTLSNSFKKQKAPSPLRIINDRIATEAKRLLLYSDKSTEKISYELGYKEPSHFSKFFKKQTGVSPLAFRKKQP